MLFHLIYLIWGLCLPGPQANFLPCVFVRRAAWKIKKIKIVIIQFLSGLPILKTAVPTIQAHLSELHNGFT